MENQTIEITLEEYKQLREMCEEFMKLEGEYKYLYHSYQQQLLTLDEYEKCLFETQEEEKEIKISKLKWKWISFWGKKRRIVYTDKLQKDEILFYGYKIYLSNK